MTVWAGSLSFIQRDLHVAAGSARNAFSSLVPIGRLSVLLALLFLLQTHTGTECTACWLSRTAVLMRLRGTDTCELTAVRRAAGWHHPQGSNDWVNSPRWLRRLQSRCVAGCFLSQPPLLLCDYCTYINWRPGLGKPDAAEPSSTRRKAVLSVQSESN